MLKVFISQPMNGRTDDEILNERSRIAKECSEIINSNVDVIDSFHKSEEDIAKGRVHMLGSSISLMNDADIVVFAPGWETAKGCLIEKQVCEQYHIPFVIWAFKDERRV